MFHHRSLQLEEERIKVLSEELKIKKSLLEDAEANYHRRLEEEIKRCSATSVFPSPQKPTFDLI